MIKRPSVRSYHRYVSYHLDRCERYHVWYWYVLSFTLVKDPNPSVLVFYNPVPAKSKVETNKTSRSRTTEDFFIFGQPGPPISCFVLVRVSVCRIRGASSPSLEILRGHIDPQIFHRLTREMCIIRPLHSRFRVASVLLSLNPI